MRKHVLLTLVAVLFVAAIGVVPHTTRAAGSASYSFYCDALVVSGTTDKESVKADVIVRWSGFPGTTRATKTISPPGSGLRAFSIVVPIIPTLTNPAPAPTTPPFDPENMEQFLWVAGFNSGEDPYTQGEQYFATGAVCSGTYFVPGCDVTIDIPAGTVGGSFVADAPLFAEPGVPVTPAATITAGNTARVIGVDKSGQYYKIIWACDYLWVPVGTMGPNHDAVWNGAPLPTTVVK